MKRLHVHLAVRDLAESMRFYSALFAAEPVVVKSDYAKWMLDDPRVNFAISARGRAPGVDHLGIQVEDEAELREVRARLENAERPVLDQPGARCCYARSDKAWIEDPQALAWETFLSHGAIESFGESDEVPRAERAAVALAAASSVAPKSCCGRGRP